MTTSVYCIDTSSLLEAWNRSYPIDIFPGLWHELESLVSSGRLVSPEEVLREIEKKDDGISEWASQQLGLFIPFDAEQESHLIYIMANHELLVKNTKRKNSADPFVIALARLKSLVVITEENEGSVAKPKIPDVCKALSIECVSILDLMKLERWKF